MKPFVWRDRLVKLEDGCFILSRKGAHDDFDFAGESPGQAVAGNPGSKVIWLEAVDEDRLRIMAMCGDFVLFGDDFDSPTTRIEPEVILGSL